jgi:RNA polymerase sigma factor (sigma-70 family)
MFTKKIHENSHKDDTLILVEEWQKTKDKAVLEEIIKRHISLVTKIANGYKGSGLDMHDLVAEGILGLIHGLEKFQVAKEVQFSTYAFYWIKSKISLYTWKMKNLIQVKFSNKNFFTYAMIKQIKEEKISYEEAVEKIKEKNNVSKGKAVEDLKYLSQKIVELNAKVHRDNDQECNWEDLLVNNEHEEMIDELEIKDLMHLVQEVLMGFNEDQKFIIHNRWLTDNPLTLQQVADKLNISVEGVRKMEIRTLSAMRETLTSRIYTDGKFTFGSLKLIFILSLIFEENIC